MVTVMLEVLLFTEAASKRLLLQAELEVVTQPSFGAICTANGHLRKRPTRAWIYAR